MEHILIGLGLGLPGMAWAIASILKARYRHKTQVAYVSVIMVLALNDPEHVGVALQSCAGLGCESQPRTASGRQGESCRQISSSTSSASDKIT